MSTAPAFAALEEPNLQKSVQIGGISLISFNLRADLQREIGISILYKFKKIKLNSQITLF
jgi:hypothetical protein